MSYTILCGDVMPGCPAQFEADDQDALVGQVAEHARTVHGIDEIPSEVAGQVAAAIRTR